MLLRALLFCAPFCVHQTFANQTFAYSFDDDDDDGGGDNAAREYEDARLSKEIIQKKIRSCNASGQPIRH